MTPTLDFMHRADKFIHHTLMELRPLLLEAQGKIGHKLKDDKSAVTEMDVLVEDRLRKALFEVDPGIAFSGEESGVDYDQQTFWLVDPIDGTESFMRGLPFATNMVALIHNGEPILSVIYNFSLDEYYLAIKGQGALCNGHAIQVSDRTLDRAFMSLGGTNKDVHEAVNLYERFRYELGINSIIKVAATGYELANVAAGRLDGRVLYKGRAKPWDFAPGALLIQEAGGKVANIGEMTYDYRNTNVVATNAVIFDQTMQFMKQVATAA